jgi:hypothetical protein
VVNTETTQYSLGECIIGTDGAVGAFSTVSAGDGAISIKSKSVARKTLGDFYIKNLIFDPSLVAIASGVITSNNIDHFLKTWNDPETPPVLKCLIADIFHKYGREKELGPLPAFYIPLKKQNHPHPQKERVLNPRETVSCMDCGARGVVCNCK